jgi:hypothetical protein
VAGILFFGALGCGRAPKTDSSSASASAAVQDVASAQSAGEATDEKKSEPLSYTNTDLGLEAVFPQSFANTSYDNMLSTGEELVMCVGNGSDQQIVIINRDMSADSDVDTVPTWVDAYASKLREVLEDNDVQVSIDFDKGTLGGVPCYILYATYVLEEEVSYHEYFFFEAPAKEGKAQGLNINLHAPTEEALTSLENCFHALEEGE